MSPLPKLMVILKTASIDICGHLEAAEQVKNTTSGILSSVYNVLIAQCSPASLVLCLLFSVGPVVYSQADNSCLLQMETRLMREEFSGGKI